MSVMTENDARNLNRLLGGFRPDWDAMSILATCYALRGTHTDLDRRVVAIAALFKSLDDTCETPNEIAVLDGPHAQHWKAATGGALLGSGGARYADRHSGNTLEDLRRARLNRNPAAAKAGYLSATGALRRARDIAREKEQREIGGVDPDGFAAQG